MKKLFVITGLILPFGGWANDSLLLQISKYEVEVDYNMTTSESVKKADFSYSDEDISNESFPSSVIPKKEKVGIYIFIFPGSTSSDSVMDCFNERNLAPTSLREMIGFSLKYPDIVRDLIIANLTVAQGPFGGQFVPVIQEELSPKLTRKTDGSRLELVLAEWKGYWRPGTAFLAVEKKFEVDSIGPISYENVAMEDLSNQCIFGKKFLKKFDLKLSPANKGKTAQAFLVRSSVPLSQNELLKR